MPKEESSRFLSVVDVHPDHLPETPCCGIKNTAHKGHIHKTAWLKKHLKKGLRSKVLLNEKNIQCGFIEYIPGEFAWRGVEAKNYMFVHCLWTFFKKYPRRGYGKLLWDSCVEDAKQLGMNGVAVIAREKPWLAQSEIFLRNGFELIEKAPPDYELLALKFKAAVDVEDTHFKGEWDRKLKRYGSGLTVIRSDQCPHSVRFATTILDEANRTYGLEGRLVELRSFRQAQNAPTPYSAFTVIYNGQLLADHQISRTRFRNLMDKVVQHPRVS